MWTSVYLASGSSLRHIRWIGRVGVPPGWPARAARGADVERPAPDPFRPPDGARSPEGRGGGRSERRSRRTARSARTRADRAAVAARAGGSRSRATSSSRRRPGSRSRPPCPPGTARPGRGSRRSPRRRTRQGALVADLPEALRLDDGLDGVPAGERLSDHGLGAGRGYGAVADQLGQVGEVPRRDRAELELGAGSFTTAATSCVSQFAACTGSASQPDRLLEQNSALARDRRQQRA